MLCLPAEQKPPLKHTEAAEQSHKTLLDIFGHCIKCLSHFLTLYGVSKSGLNTLYMVNLCISSKMSENVSCDRFATSEHAQKRMSLPAACALARKTAAEFPHTYRVCSITPFHFPGKSHFPGKWLCYPVRKLLCHSTQQRQGQDWQVFRFSAGATHARSYCNVGRRTDPNYAIAFGRSKR